MSHTCHYSIIKEGYNTVIKGYNTLTNSIDLPSYKLSYDTTVITSFVCSTSEFFYYSLNIRKPTSSIIFQPLKCIPILNRVTFYMLKLNKTCSPVLSGWWE